MRRPTLKRLLSFMERSLKIGQVIVLAVMMRDQARGMMQRSLPNIRQPTFYQCQHILSRIVIEQPPFAIHGDVNG